jgi:LDH2 family malate/lactate/ureidoglycolate dehydrogenase
MAEYPESENEQRVDAAALERWVTAIFSACGMSEPQARLVAHTLVKADLRGIHSHGVLRVPEYVFKLTQGGVDPRGAPSLTVANGGALVVDGGNAMGQIAADFAMSSAINCARTCKVAVAAVNHSNHCGALDYWVIKAVDEGMIGIASTNALPTMAPWGGLDKIVGMNPISIGFPALEEPAVVLDIAFGATAHGKMRVYRQKGAPLPEGWAFDKDGRPTTDVEKALAGLIQPVGGHKGVGLAIMMGMLSTLLSGASYGTQLGNMEDGAQSGRDGQVFIAIEAAAFQPLDEIRRRVDAISREIRTSRRRAGVDRLYPPGLLEAAFEKERAKTGIPLNDETIADLAKTAQGLGVSAFNTSAA